jgi:AcrR family transcriptional regulator
MQIVECPQHDPVGKNPFEQLVLKLPARVAFNTRDAMGSPDSQRGRLLFAVAQVVAEKGYGARPVADVVERASVSRTTFYEMFRDKEACFLAAFSFGVEVVLGQMRAVSETLGDPDDWRAHVRSA